MDEDEYNNFAQNPLLWMHKGGFENPSEPKRMTILVENPSDVEFWKAILNNPEYCDIEAINCANLKDGFGKQSFKPRYANLNEYLVIARDADFDYLCALEDVDHHNAINGNYVMHTYLYGRENFHLYIEFIKKYLNHIKYIVDYNYDDDLSLLLDKYSELCDLLIPLYLFNLENNIVEFDRDKLQELLSIDFNCAVLRNSIYINHKYWKGIIASARCLHDDFLQRLPDVSLYSNFIDGLVSKEYIPNQAYGFAPCHIVDNTFTQPLFNQLVLMCEHKCKGHLDDEDIEPTQLGNLKRQAVNFIKERPVMPWIFARYNELTDHPLVIKINKDFNAIRDAQKKLEHKLIRDGKL